MSETGDFFLSLWERTEVRVRSLASGTTCFLQTKRIDLAFSQMTVWRKPQPSLPLAIVISV